MPLVQDSSALRIPVTLAVNAGNKRRSKHTGFVHFCYNGKGEEYRETIPTLENFAYVLALFRTKDMDNISRARKVLCRLLAFEVNGDFPLYLHEYPDCSSPSISAHLLPAMYWMLQDELRSVLGAELFEPLKNCLERCLQRSRQKLQENHLSWNAQIKLMAAEGTFSPKKATPKSARDWGDFLIACTMSGEDSSRAFANWHRDLCCFTGVAGQRFEGSEPEVTLFDLFMGHYFGSYSNRALADHPMHLQAALVYPVHPLCVVTHAQQGSHFEQADEKHPFGLYWGTGKRLHSLVCPSASNAIEIGGREGRRSLLVTLPQAPPKEKEAPVEWTLFLDRHPKCEILVSGKRANLFRLEDELTIVSHGCNIQVTFEIIEGEGTFCGHLFFESRPSQIPSKRRPPPVAYDWQIGLRTVRRSSNLALRIMICTLA